MKKTLILLTIVLAFLSVMVQQAPVVSSQTVTPVRDMIGTNAVVNDTASDLAQAVGWVRDYHKWYWYEATKDVYTWSTGWQKLDQFYGALKAAGVKVMPDVEFAPGWASSNGSTDGVPNAAEHAQYLGQLVKHYGDTIAAVENFNEPNQTWQPVPFPASVFGAMTAQDYAAVKAANPNMPLVLAGMAGPDTNYLEAARQASGGKFDVVNIHWYAEGDNANGGKNPESGGLMEAINRVKSWRDSKAPGRPIWISEFGWDTFAQPDGRKSKIYAPEANAANYLLRAFAIMQAHGVDRSFLYTYRDVSDNSAYLHNVYLSSGLVANNAEKDGRKKPGWYFVTTLKNVLGDYAFDRIVSDGPNIYHYEYQIPGTNKRAAMLWARSGQRDSGYRVSYQGPAGTLVVPTNGSTTGARSSTNGQLTLSETPVFVLYQPDGAVTAPAPTTTPTGTPTTAPSSVPTATPTPVPTTAPTSAPTVAPTATAQPSPTQGAEPSAERLSNGGFESGLSNWYVPSWYSKVIKADGTVTHGGSQALQFKGNTGGPFTYQEVPAAPGQTVTVSGWINTTQIQGDGSMVVELVSRHGYNGDLRTFQVMSSSKATNGWERFSGSAVMPDRTASVRLQIRFPKLYGTTYFDDLSLTVAGGGNPVSTATPTRPPVIPSPTKPATATPVPTSATRPPATATLAPAQPTATPTAGPAQPTVTPTAEPAQSPVPTVPPSNGGGVLAGTAWPTYGQNVMRNNRSPYAGPRVQPLVKWSFSRSSDHWGTDYRGTGIGQNGTVYLAAGMAGVYAVDSNSGQMKWLYSPDNTGHETWVEFPPTVASDGTLYFTSENDWLYAMDPNNGKVKWSFLSNHLHTPVSISPDGTTLHFVSENGYAYALNRADGKLKWQYQLGTSTVYGTGRRIPVVYDSAGNLFFSWINTVWSLTPDGQKRWSVTVPQRGPYMVGPAVADDGTMYWVYSQSVFAVGMDGKQKWEYTLGKSAFDRTPALGTDGTIYIGAEDGYVYALNPNGTLKWKVQVATNTGWGGGVKSNLLLDSRGILYFLTKDQNIQALDTTTQKVLWKYNTGYGDNSYPGIQLSLDSDGTLYSPVNEGVMVALSASGGSGSEDSAPTSTPLPTIEPTPTPAPASTPVPTVAAVPTPESGGGIMYGAWVGSTVNVAGDEAGYEQATGKPRLIRHWYASVAPLSNNAANFAAWSQTMQPGEMLMLSFSPAPTDSSLAKLNAGAHDGYISDWAKALKAYGKEVLLRPMWEDNGNWFWWYSGADWDTASKAKFKTAFQRVVNIFRQQGATNVKFVWSPNASGFGAGTASLSYPGDAYVDWVALDGYPEKGGRGDFYSTFKADYDALGKLGKPMMIAETGISIHSDGERAAYMKNLLTYELPVRFPGFKALVWFNEPPYGELVDSRYPLTLDAVKKALASPYYRGR